MTNTGRSGVVLFVHGFGSSSKCWTPLITLLQKDERLKARYEFKTWDYPSKWFELNVLGRIPRLEEVGRALGDEIDSPVYRGRALTLVGHSQGGLVIQAYIADLLQSGQASKLRGVNQAVLFATPNEGSTTAFTLRRFLYKLFSNPQEATLRVLNPDVADIRAVIRERVVAATRDTESAWRLPIHAFSGLQDDVVPEASARGPFDNVKRVKGTHFTILNPDDAEDPRYSEFAELLLDPGGHAHRYDVDHYEAILKVEPRQPQVIKTKTLTPREVKFDNVASLKRTVRFSPINRCRTPFAIRYGTRNDGYVVGHTSHTNEASAVDKGRAEDTGAYFQFDFTPRPNENFCLNVEVFNGFAEGHRDVHFHLGDSCTFRSMRYVVDLSAYVGAGYVISQPPRFYLHAEDHEHGEMCSRRGACEPLVPSSESPNGIYEWRLADIKQAIVDITWDVAAKGAAPSIAATSHTDSATSARADTPVS